MPSAKQNYIHENPEIEWKNIILLGAIAAIIALTGILIDIIAGPALVVDLSEVPEVAVQRFAQFNNNPWLGLYNLDFLNTLVQIIMIPTYFALFAVHRKVNPSFAALALIIFLVGTTIMVVNNTALQMLDLSGKYAAAVTETQKSLLAAAGETLLLRGAHGSPGTLFGFIIPTIGGIMMSIIMLKGKIFNKVTSVAGIMGNTFLLLYLVFVTFIPGIETIAMIAAMPGGLLYVVWVIMFTIKLFQLIRSEKPQKS